VRVKNLLAEINEAHSYISITQNENCRSSIVMHLKICTDTKLSRLHMQKKNISSETRTQNAVIPIFKSYSMQVCKFLLYPQ